MFFNILTHKVINGLIGSELAEPSVDPCVGRKITKTNLLFEFQLNRMVRIQQNTGFNYENNLFKSPWHLEVDFSTPLEHLFFLMNPKYENNGWIISKVI